MTASGRIRLLSDTLANQIAAGEVIERPAAVVKELVENALDAGARRIEVDLRAGGLELIRVRDDGSGMSRADAELCLQRHATSKLQSKEDLFSISTYGFRGEALPSIAAVSRFALVTAEPGATAGVRIEVMGGQVGQVEPAASAQGTTVEVRDLFWNVPARRKFLKRWQTEQAYLLEAVLRLAIPRCDVSFTVREAERVLLRLSLESPERALATRAEEALGRDVRGALLPFTASVREVRVHGLAASPSVQHGNAKAIWLFVNGRAIRDRQLSHAVLRAYGEVLPHGRYPAALVFLEVPPSEVDVNVHPAKAEVRLLDGRGAYEAIVEGLRRRLAPGDHLHLTGTEAVAATRTYGLVSGDGASDAQSVGAGLELPGGVANAPPAAAGRVAETFQPFAPGLFGAGAFFSALRFLGQLHRTYLVCEGPRGLVLIDQHAAHERIQYQRLRRQAANGAAPLQPLLVPRLVELSSSAAAAVGEAAALLAQTGLELEAFGGSAMLVKALPLALSGLTDAALGALLADLADELVGQGSTASLDRRRDALLARAACHASVRAHDALAPGEALALLAELDVTDYGARCAHGRPVVAEWSVTEIEKRFGRHYESHDHAAAPETL